ncbi:MAG TPA: 50S ribosomal protein L11 methyltransferase [Thermoanaerobaculia bacterium]|nr:50S ribosomal protein L11 methyltransferase [Thermoanaerobaculia bacterium]
MTCDFVLEISYESSRDDEVQARLYLTRSTGSSSVENGGVVTLTAYFDSPVDRDDAQRAFAGFDVRVDDRACVDWLERYEQSLEPMSIGRSFVVAPDPSLIPENSGRIAIVVPQEQAFGTGSHESTWLCLEMLERLDLRGRRGLDIGSGSGILAMAMQRLGAAKVIAFDNDLDAYGPLRDNRVRNRIPESAMPLFIGGIESLRGGTFDAVTMNILPEVIIPLLPEVKRHLRGTLILSGVLTTVSAGVITAAVRHGFRLGGEAERGEWWAGMFALG